MFKMVFIILIFCGTLQAQSPSFFLTQKGSDSQKSLFLNPSMLSIYKQQQELELSLVNGSAILSHDSYTFLEELSETTSSANKGQDIAALLKKNIGNTITLLAHNFSSLQGNHENLVWSLGIADSFNAYYIPHTGFGSKGALESAIEKYRIIMGTLAYTKQNFHYGVNLKSMKKTLQNHNYSIQEMINAQDIETYLRTNKGQSDTSFGLDTGVSYACPSDLNPIVHLSFLDIGQTSFEDVGSIPSTANIGLSLKPYDETILALHYLDLFKSHPNQTFHQQVRVNLSHTLFDTLQLDTGVLNKALLYGLEYQSRYVNVGLHSYKTHYEHPERKYELSFKLQW